MSPLTAYADPDTPRRMRGDCRVLSVRISLPDPRDRHLSVGTHRAGVVGVDRVAALPHSPDAAAALVAQRLGL